MNKAPRGLSPKGVVVGGWPGVKRGALAVLLAAVASPSAAEELSSVYTDLDRDSHCTVFAVAPEGDGDWANLVCDGWRGYPVTINYADARESVFYGYPPSGDMAPVWESFDAFNAAGSRIEWRLERRGESLVPFATIHRWSVSDADDPEDKIEVLVVEKVGQPGTADGCAVAYVVATGNEGANEKARSFADRIARDFECGADQPSIDAGEVPVPSFSRSGG